MNLLKTFFGYSLTKSDGRNINCNFSCNFDLLYTYRKVNEKNIDYLCVVQVVDIFDYLL